MDQDQLVDFANRYEKLRKSRAESQKRYYEKNKERCQAKGREYYYIRKEERNPEKK